MNQTGQLCRVCGEPAAGFHFGAFTCEGCKSFFGRSFDSKKTLVADCKTGGKCEITGRSRTACKLCRFKKCLLVGMSKSGSRYGRRSNWFKLHCILQQNDPDYNKSSKGSGHRDGGDIQLQKVTTTTSIDNESSTPKNSPTPGSPMPPLYRNPFLPWSQALFQDPPSIPTVTDYPASSTPHSNLVSPRRQSVIRSSPISPASGKKIWRPPVDWTVWGDDSPLDLSVKTGRPAPLDLSSKR